jgi:hypothetical protein
MTLLWQRLRSDRKAKVRFLHLYQLVVAATVATGCVSEAPTGPVALRTEAASLSIGGSGTPSACEGQIIQDPQCESVTTLLVPVPFESIEATTWQSVEGAVSGAGTCSEIFSSVRGRLRYMGLEYAFRAPGPHVLRNQLPPLPGYPGPVVHGVWESLAGQFETDNGGLVLEGEWRGLCHPIVPQLPMVTTRFLEWLGRVYRRGGGGWGDSGGDVGGDAGGGDTPGGSSGPDQEAIVEFECVTYEFDDGSVWLHCERR